MARATNSIADLEYEKFDVVDGDIFVRTKAMSVGRKNTENSTAIPLTGGATFTGDWIDVSAYTSIVTATLSDQSGTLQMQFSTSGSGSADSSLSYPVAENVNEVHRLAVTRQYYRSVFVNDATAQTSFDLSTIFGNHNLISAPLNLTLGQDADSIVVRSIDSELDISQGKRAGFEIINKFGRNEDIDSGTVPEDIWEGGGVYTGFPLTDDELVTVVSSSINDTSAGSGARTVQIYGLDTDGMEQSEILTLNGQTKVDSVNTYTRCNRLIVLTSGSSNQAFNAGVLTVQHKTTTANIFCAVPVGTNQSQIACYTVPMNKTAYLRSLEVTMNRSNSASCNGVVWVRENGASPRSVRIFSLSQSNSYRDDIYGGLVFTPLTDIAIRITSSTANNIDIVCNFDIVLIKN